MSSADHADLAQEYWKHHQRATSADRSDRLRAEAGSWANDAVDDAVMKRADGVVRLLVALADSAAEDNEALMYLGAGPIESLLCHHDRDLPQAMIDELEAAARQHPPFRTALQGVGYGPHSDDPRVVSLLDKYGRRPS